MKLVISYSLFSCGGSGSYESHILYIDTLWKKWKWWKLVISHIYIYIPFGSSGSGKSSEVRSLIYYT